MRKGKSGVGAAIPLPLVNKIILILLQIFILFAVFKLTWQALYASVGITSTNITYLVILLAIMVAYFVLAKFQLVIEDVTLKNETLERQFEGQTQNLFKIIEDLRAEIDERKRAKAALLESDGYSRAIIREAALGIAIIDKQGILQEGNPVLHEMLGYDPPGLQGVSFMQLLFPEDAPQSEKFFNELLHGQCTRIQTEQRLVRKDGNIVWGRQFISLARDDSGSPKFFIAMIEDVTGAH